MKGPYFFFKNTESLDERLKQIPPFYLVYPMGSIDDLNLKTITERCIAHESCQGIAFRIDKEKYFFEELFFLRTIIEKLLYGNKCVGLWGLPRCVCRRILGGYFYMRLLCSLIPEPNICEDTHEEKFFKEACGNCIDRTTCQGLGKKNYQDYKPLNKRTDLPGISEYPLRRFGSGNDLLTQKHQAFIRHITNIKSPATYRTVYYAANFDFHSVHSYKNRFIYQCDYLSPDEYSIEFGFLKEQAVNRTFVNLLESMADIDRISQIAYSLAEKNGSLRESFYMFVTKRYGAGLLDDMGIRYKIPRTRDMHFIGIGMDVVDRDTRYFKLYFRSPKAFINSYFEAYGIDLSPLKYKSHYVVIRLDRLHRFLSYKIEIFLTYDDLYIFKQLLPDYEYFAKNLARTLTYNMTVEFENGRISKINMYHRGDLAGGGP